MRERLARAVSALALVTLVALSVAFARDQNAPAGAATPSEAADLPGEAGPPSEPGATRPPAESGADSLRGRAAFEARGCMRCHSVAGVGSPRYPLDGVGSRRTPAELRAWTVGADVLADSLAPGVLRTKQAFREIPARELDAILAYLASLKGRP